jgi:PPK2 family polyphosphate:nucleotide phosphotransferase
MGEKRGKVPGKVTEALTVPRDAVDLASYDTRATPAFDGGKAEGKQALAAMGDELSALQERLFAEGRAGGERRILLVLQGMDTSGKGGTLRHTIDLFDPQGVHTKAFAAPTPAEKRHHFLWRVRKELPGPGIVGGFDRSYYEDVIVARVRRLSSTERIEARYDEINELEEELVESGTVLLKCLLHISPDEQKDRLLQRLDRPDKHWKFDPGDIDDRALWPAYQEAYQVAVERCSDAAPWLVVPADRKWYRNWAVAAVLLEALQRMDLRWPEADFDVDEQRRRLTHHDPLG